MFTKESKAVLHGEYGALPGKVNEEVRKKAIGEEPVITCRPADLLAPELDKYRDEIKDVIRQEDPLCPMLLRLQKQRLRLRKPQSLKQTR